MKRRHDEIRNSRELMLWPFVLPWTPPSHARIASRRGLRAWPCRRPTHVHPGAGHVRHAADRTDTLHWHVTPIARLPLVFTTRRFCTVSRRERWRQPLPDD